MLSRKPVPSRNPESASTAPYPASPTAPSASDGHASAYQPPNDNDLSLHRSRSSSASSHNTWNSGFSSDHEDDDNNQPKSESNDIPASLRVGRSQPSAPAQQSFQSHNPYHNLHNHAQAQTQPPPYPSEDSQSIWSSAPAQPTTAPPPPPSQPPPSLPPAPTFAALSLDDHVQQNSNAEGLGPPPPVIPQKSSRRSFVSQTSSNPWQQDLDREQNGHNPWQSTPSPQRHQLETIFQPPPGPPPALVPPPRRNYQSTPSPPPAPAAPPLAFNASPTTAPPAPPPPSLSQQSNPPLSQPTVNPPVPQEESLIDFGTIDAPPPPIANPEPVSAPQPERTNLAAPIESAEELLSKQRNVTYHIKQINWFDAAAGPNGSMRRCPILTQNANGPCPLLALVNALTLSAPEGPKTILVDTLSSREQISLGLLLDAVFEELARRTEISSKALPDVGDLYSFLITLHTGMNVNPRFVTPPDCPQGKPGGFDDTREMRLYSAFEVPLVHGWVPTSMSSAYEAFDRSAKTFDDAQNIQFAQAELEHKLGSDGLSAQEQQLFEDIINIREFMTSYPTQLTEHGLKLMTDFFKPGQIAILFRNDHFSTLYKQPRSGTLMNLVTDAGYSSHDEIVWESLVDVSGAAGNFFSGDFRPVGNTPSGAQNGNDWQTVPSGSNHGGGAAANSASAAQSQPPTEPREHGSEQEDADLALALQLQEEEEDRQRQAEASRRRQDELSRQFLERESASSGRSPTSEQRPPVPPRRSNMNTNSNSSRNNAPPTADAPYIRERDDGDDEPPTYEQAASDRPYRPAGATRDPRQGDALGALTALQMQQGPFANQNGNHPNGQPPSMHRRRSSAMGLGRTNSNSQRLRRQQSQGQGPQTGAGHDPSPQYSGYVPPGSGGRISQAEREERCNVM